MRIDNKYSYLNGTHCWYCNRQFEGNRSRLRMWSLTKTKDHIIPKSKCGANDPENYIACCCDCNSVKRNLDAKQFAELIEELHQQGTGFHNMFSFFPMMKVRAWKIYNKTHKTHRIAKKFYQMKRKEIFRQRALNKL